MAYWMGIWIEESDRPAEKAVELDIGWPEDVRDI